MSRYNHDKRVRKYAAKYFDDYLTNVEYWGDARGEIDIYAFVGDTLYLVEYKKSNNDHSFRKAVKQMRMAEEWVVPTGVDYELIFMWDKGKYKSLKKRNDRNCSLAISAKKSIINETLGTI